MMPDSEMFDNIAFAAILGHEKKHYQCSRCGCRATGLGTSTYCTGCLEYLYGKG